MNEVNNCRAAITVYKANNGDFLNNFAEKARYKSGRRKIMAMQAIIDGLYKEVLFVAMILLSILLVNNLVLYKQKLKDRLSLMLLNAVIMCAFEIVWVFCEKHPNLRVLTYIGACGYTISFVTLTAFLNSYILERFDRLPKSKWFYALFYYVPVGAFSLVSITTPFTHWLVEVDEAGVLHENILFDGLFVPLMVLYVVVAAIFSIAYAIRSRQKKHTATMHVAYSMVVFTALIPAIYFLEVLLLGIDSGYLALSLAVSVSMVYLTTNISTHTLLETNAKMAATESELNFATDIQTSVLPNIFPPYPDREDFSIFASMTPAKEVGGDFYDFFMVDDDHLALVMADVAGKGIPAALFMMSSKILIKNHTMSGGSPGAVLRTVNNQICENNREEMFVTVWLGILDLRDGKLVSANAGHEYPVLKTPDGDFELIKGKHSFVIGGMEGMKFRESEMVLEPGSKLFVYTDGVPEAENQNEEQYGYERFLKALNSKKDGTPEELLEATRNSVKAFVQDHVQFDDLTMLCVHYTGERKEETDEGADS